MSFTTHDQMIGLTSTRYYTWGDPQQDPLLLLHDGAWGGSALVSWDEVGERLAEHHFVIAPDLLGFGESDKTVQLGVDPYKLRLRQIAGLLGVLELEHAPHVVGTSFGGSLALRGVSKGVIEARSVVSISGSGGPWRTPVAHQNLSDWDGTRQDLARVQSYLIDDGDGFNQQLDRRYQMAIQPGHFRAMKALSVKLPDSLKEVRSPDEWPQSIENYDGPTLLISGARDRLLELNWHNHILAHAKHGSHVELDCQHSPNIDLPDATSETILDFTTSI